MEIQTLGVVGAGQMGNGIAHVAAQSGFDVILQDISEEALARGMATIQKNLDRQIRKGRLDEHAAAAVVERGAARPAAQRRGERQLGAGAEPNG